MQLERSSNALLKVLYGYLQWNLAPYCMIFVISQFPNFIVVIDIKSLRLTLQILFVLFLLRILTVKFRVADDLQND